MLEIERKFLLGDIPFDLSPFEYDEIEQGYISADPAIRVRRKGESLFLTVKSGGGTERQEFEIPLTRVQFDALWQKTGEDIVVKTRYYIPLEGGLTAELDVYGGALAGLKTVEVEFETREDARRFTPPDWFGADVSEEQAWSNSSLARFGRPFSGYLGQ